MLFSYLLILCRNLRKFDRRFGRIFITALTASVGAGIIIVLTHVYALALVSVATRLLPMLVLVLFPSGGRLMICVSANVTLTIVL